MAFFDGVAKISPHGVVVIFQDFDILVYVFVPEKLPGLVGQNFCLAIMICGNNRILRE
jgi:hypothetical protein